MKYSREALRDAGPINEGRRGAFTSNFRGKARTLTPRDIERIEHYISRKSRYRYADLLKFRLSVYAGLRVAEIAATRVADLTDGDGKIDCVVRVRASSAKNNHARSIPMHSKIRAAMQDFLKYCPDSEFIALARHKHGKQMHVQTVNGLQLQMKTIYTGAGLAGCSSHSGRRTFITNLSRSLGKDFSLRDVQVLAGHARLDTTMEYIDTSGRLEELVRRLK